MLTPPLPGAPRAPLSLRLAPLYLSFVSLMLFRSRSFAEALETGVDLANLHRIVAVGLVFVLAGQRMIVRGVPRRWPAALLWFTCYLSVGVVSTSISADSGFSFWKLGELLSAVVVGVYVLRVARADPGFALEAYSSWLGFLRFLVVAALVGAALLPGEALRSPLTEASIAAYGTPLLPVQLSGVLVLVHSNSLGAITAILLFVHAVRMVEGTRRPSPRQVAWLGVLIAVLVLAQSRTAWAGLAAATCVAVLFSRRLSAAAKIGMAATVATALYLYLDQVGAYFTRGVSLAHLSTLSGRTGFWTAALREFSNADAFASLFGLGFVVANRTLLTQELDSSAATLHSDYIDALVSTGFLGAAFLVLAIGSFVAVVFRALVAAPSSVLRLELAGIATMLLVRSFTGTTFAIHNVFFLGFVITAVLAALVGRIEGARIDARADGEGAVYAPAVLPPGS